LLLRPHLRPPGTLRRRNLAASGFVHPPGAASFLATEKNLHRIMGWKDL